MNTGTNISPPRSFKLLVCDLDNTLYDWVSYFVPSFYAMVDKVLELTDWDREHLLDEFQQVHEKHHDSEHPFALLETASVKAMFPDGNLKAAKDHFDEAFHAFNSMRKKTLVPFPNVHETLNMLLSTEMTIVAHTESKLHAVVDRLRRLDLIKYFDKVFCRERGESNHPDRNAAEGWFEGFPMERVVELSHHQRKPDPTLLREICDTMGFTPSNTVYVGDSIAHDIMMAKEAGVFAIWAAYGTERDLKEWEKLVRITHWTPKDVTREKQLREAAQEFKPDFVAESSFSEILQPLGLTET